MKTTEIATITLTTMMALFALTTLSYAHTHECVEEHWIFLGNSLVSSGSCTALDKLELSTTMACYPKMQSNPYSVEYWKGSFIKTAQFNRRYQHEVVDECTGRVIVSERTNLSARCDFNFAVNNPNLSPDIAASYDLLPMTPDEAAAALKTAQSDCEKFVPDSQDLTSCQE